MAVPGGSRAKPSPRRVLFALLLTIGLVLATAVSADAAGVGRVRIGTNPPIPAGAQAVGPLAQATPVQATVALQPADPSALAAYAQAVSTPGSSLYHRYLNVAGFAQRFGARPAQVAAVRATLRAAGLQPGPLTANGLSFSVRASAAALSSAFSTSFERYRLRNGHVGFVNTSAPTVPATIGGLVQGVVGLNTLVLRHPQAVRRATGPLAPHAAASPRVAMGGPQPCAAGTGSNTGPYSADQIASAYGFSGLYGSGDLGSGVTVALYELEPFAPSDIAAYQSCYGTTTSVATQNVDGGPGSSGAGAGEAALDIEDVIGLAPKANVRVYQGPNSGNGPYDTYSQIINDDQAQVISTSWGLCESQEGSGEANSENTLFQQAAVQGQSIFAAAGDSGAADCTDAIGTPLPGQAVDDPASQPFVTGVGGTTLSALGPPPTESVWNNNSPTNPTGGAGGGGVSTLWSRPSYQSGFAQTQSSQTCGSSGYTCREVPDVSADADPNTGYVIYYSGGWYRFGGTSAAAPTWASLTAVIDASSSCNGTEVGFANAALYRAAGTSYSSRFNDVQSGNNNYGTTTGYSAGTRYDMASGLGTPQGSALASALCGNPNDSVTFSNPPGSQSSQAGTTISPLTVHASSSSSPGSTITYSASNLPIGLSIDKSSGTISGTPNAAGSYPVTVRAVDSNYTVGTASFTWNVAGQPAASSSPTSPSSPSSPSSPTSPTSPTSTPAAPAPEVSLSAPAAQRARVATPAHLQLRASDSGGLALKYSAGNLPSGLSINAGSGLISGTPRQGGRFNVRVAVVDSRGNSATASFPWTIVGRPSATATSLRLLRGRSPRLSLRLSAGLYAPSIKRVVIGGARTLQLSSRARRLTRGLSLAGPSGSRLKANSQIRRGTLTVTLGRTANLVSLQVSPPVLSLSRSLAASIARHRAKPVTVAVAVTDASGFTTRLLVRLRAG